MSKKPSVIRFSLRSVGSTMMFSHSLGADRKHTKYAFQFGPQIIFSERKTKELLCLGVLVVLCPIEL